MFRQSQLITIYKSLSKFILLSLITMSSYAEVSNCEQFYRSKNYTKAFVECNELVENYDITGVAIIGLMFYHGYMVQQNTTRATMLFKKSKSWIKSQAESGNVDAEQALGIMYALGNKDVLYDCGVELNLENSIYWFTKAAKSGDRYSQYRLGVIAMSGRAGVKPDYNKAMYWYKQTADMGYPAGQFGMAELYSNGLGVAKDYKQAVYWYELAANQGYLDAQLALGNMYQIGRGVKQDYAKACSWYEKAAVQGDTRAQRALSNMPNSCVNTKN